MASIPHTLKDPQPLYYADKLTVWFKAMLSPTDLAELKRLSPNLFDRDGSIEPMRFNRDWIYCIKATQPSHPYMEALERIATTQPMRINLVELARDECCTSRLALEALDEYRYTHEVRLWHSKNQTLHRYPDGSGNTYDARQNRARVLTRYMEKECRITGEPHCLHTEIRLKGAQSVERAGIYTIRHLIDFDHAAWWAAKTRMLSAPNVERLGRLIRNKQAGTRRQHAQIETWPRGLVVNLDEYRGTTAWIGVGWCVQALVDAYGGVGKLLHSGVLIVV